MSPLLGVVSSTSFTFRALHAARDCLSGFILTEGFLDFSSFCCFLQEGEKIPSIPGLANALVGWLQGLRLTLPRTHVPNGTL